MMSECKKEYLNSWIKVPKDLTDLIGCHTRGVKGLMRPILEYLMIRKNDSESATTGVTREEYIVWVDFAIENGLYPVELHMDDWESNISAILQLLALEHEFLERFSPKDYKTEPWTDFNRGHSMDWIGLRQRLNVYYATAFIFAKKIDEFLIRLDRVLDDSKRNLSYLMNENNCEQLLKNDSWSEAYHLPGIDRYRPIHWLAQECSFTQKAQVFCIEAYQEYLKTLHGLIENKNHAVLCKSLVMRTGEELRDMCEFILSDIEVIIEEEDEEEVVDFLRVKKPEIEKILRDCEQRITTFRQFVT